MATTRRLSAIYRVLNSIRTTRETVFRTFATREIATGEEATAARSAINSGLFCKSCDPAVEILFLVGIVRIRMYNRSYR